MKSTFILGLILTFLVACTDSTEEKSSIDTDDGNLIEIKNNQYIEYYPGKKAIKIQGMQDENGMRDGKWSYFNENGKEMSYTFFKNGKKHGFSYNSYPNGSPYYYGEYWEDTMIGVWKTYDSKGEIIEKDYGLPAGY